MNYTYFATTNVMQCGGCRLALSYTLFLCTFSTLTLNYFSMHIRFVNYLVVRMHVFSKDKVDINVHARVDACVQEEEHRTMSVSYLVSVTCVYCLCILHIRNKQSQTICSHPPPRHLTLWRLVVSQSFATHMLSPGSETLWSWNPCTKGTVSLFVPPVSNVSDQLCLSVHQCASILKIKLTPPQKTSNLVIFFNSLHSDEASVSSTAAVQLASDNPLLKACRILEQANLGVI